ncbi:synaptogyrin-4 [Erinaceus europaeus]|uniref:Synaptogyrin n=1 Tax=Erinaceus europaeus TaxID=9365 RepID=A0A1S3AK33_ERIEU|nr:synaptogyrin-4 [Erinaceus europaeus]XP_060029663.1 synaptogyrin-4 [Erinaceus europaeus]
MHIPDSLQDLADNEVVQFLKKRKTVGRIFSGVFSLVIFSTLLTDGFQNQTDSAQLHCVLGGGLATCRFAVGAGVLAFLCCLLFLLLDARWGRAARLKPGLQLLDLGVAVLWTAVWFGGFCFLVSQWQHSPKQFTLGSSSAKAAIAFTFFSVFSWMFQAYLAFQDLRSKDPVPYKRSLDEGGVILTSLSPPSAASPIHTPTPGPTSLTYSTSSLSPHLTNPKGPRLVMMPDDN